MQVKLDFRSKVPIYVQIIDHIKYLIVTGQLRPDDQLPTIRQLAVDLKVNFTTVARAYRILDDEGLISTQHGRGTYVLPPQPEREKAVLRREDLDHLTSQYLTEAQMMGYSLQEIRDSIEQQLRYWNSGKGPGGTDESK